MVFTASLLRVSLVVVSSVLVVSTYSRERVC